jgi:GrpB-like predicted nucleotidyltransferase (UPF0157 family)
MLLTGIQKVFEKGMQISDETIAFVGNLFARSAEIPGTAATDRYVAYRIPMDDSRELVFMGMETVSAGRIPPGMVSWVLGEHRWEILECRNTFNVNVYTAAINWLWSTPTCGDFTFRSGRGELDIVLPESGEADQAVNAYVARGKEIEDGDRIRIVDYDPGWPDRFFQCKRWIEDHAGPAITRIEHFGSTSVPGAAAKPVIDILIGVSSFAVARKHFIPLLDDPRWEYWWTDDHLMFIQRESFMGRRTHHLHLLVPGHQKWHQLAFRDYLRTHPAAVKEYGALKKELADRFGEDREGYTQAKGDFINRVVGTAPGTCSGFF